MICDYLIIMCCVGIVSVIVCAVRLYKYRMILDMQYRAMVDDIMSQQHEINKDLAWLDKKCRELEKREDRIRQREKELNFLK